MKNKKLVLMLGVLGFGIGVSYGQERHDQLLALPKDKSIIYHVIQEAESLSKSHKKLVTKEVTSGPKVADLGLLAAAGITVSLIEASWSPNDVCFLDVSFSDPNIVVRYTVFLDKERNLKGADMIAMYCK